MPSSKRKPIEYTSQAGSSIFRAPELVEQELAAVEGPDDPAVEVPDGRTDVRPSERIIEPSSVVPTVDSTVAPEVAPVLPPIEEPRIRHSFDIPKRQLDALYDIQDRRRRTIGKKPKMGDLVAEALDLFIRQNET